ncbi:MAG: endonuclease III [Polyangia bacterium]
MKLDPKLVTRTLAIADALEELYPEVRCELDFTTPFELLVATILSAQCTDKRVNLVTPALFARFPDARAMSDAPIAELEALVRSTGFYHNKAKNIVGTARLLMERFAGAVPHTMDELLTLPGVARKTGNVILGTAFELEDGIAVDTHVMRLSHRLGLTSEEDPVKIERDLCALLPRARWTRTGHQIIWHGRRVCDAKAPRCDDCTLAPLCPSAFKVMKGARPGAVAKRPVAKKPAAKRQAKKR